MIADTPEEFAAAVVELYTVQSTWKLIQSNAKATVEAHLSRTAAKKALQNIVR